MPQYPYKCNTCGAEIDLECSMDDERPKSIPCEKCKGELTRVWGKGQTIKIPFQWNEHTFKFDKSPSKRKHYY